MAFRPTHSTGTSRRDRERRFRIAAPAAPLCWIVKVVRIVCGWLGRVGDDAVSASVLGAIERLVRAPQQRVGRVAGTLCARDADADGDVELTRRAADGERCAFDARA